MVGGGGVVVEDEGDDGDAAASASSTALSDGKLSLAGSADRDPVVVDVSAGLRFSSTTICVDSYIASAARRRSSIIRSLFVGARDASMVSIIRGDNDDEGPVGGGGGGGGGPAPVRPACEARP